MTPIQTCTKHDCRLPSDKAAQSCPDHSDRRKCLHCGYRHVSFDHEEAKHDPA